MTIAMHAEHAHQRRCGAPWRQIVRVAFACVLLSLLAGGDDPPDGVQPASSSSATTSWRPSFASAASAFPGLPMPVDTVHVCCTWDTLLPRDKFVFTSGTMIYIFDSIQQEARQLFTTETLFTAPIGAGVSMSADKIAGWGRFNTTSWWSPRNMSYWFDGDSYWRWRPASDGTPSGQTTIASGWLSGVTNLNGFLTASAQWSYFFVDTQMWRYDNLLDAEDTTATWPQNTADVFTGGFPAGGDMTDIDLHPERQEWTIFLNDNTYMLYSPTKSRVLDGYPRAIHNDSFDGGVNGMNRTRCSGLLELSSMIGFAEDKSPTDELRAMPYADGLTCEWLIEVPSRILQTPSIGFRGYEWYFPRFDLGSGAKIEIEELLDLPVNSLVEGGWWYDVLVLRPEWDALGSFNALTPDRSRTPRRLATYTQANPPTMAPLLPVGRSSNQSMTLRVRFTTTTDVGTAGTGFALRFAVATPTLERLEGFNGIFWFSNLGLENTTRAYLIAPATQTNTIITFTIRFNLYPLKSEYMNLVAVTATSQSTGRVINVCTGAILYLDGYVGARCVFSSTADDGFVLLTYTVNGTGFASNVVGEFAATTFCNNSPTTPQNFSAVTGVLQDGSGPHWRYRVSSDCSYVLAAPTSASHPDSGALFITLAFTELDLYVLTDKFTSGTGRHRILVYDGNTTSATLLRTLTYDDSSTVSMPSVSSTTPNMFVRFLSGTSYTDLGWSAGWTMYYPPLLSTLSLTGFTALTSAVITAHLVAISSTSASLVYAGVTSSTITLACVDKHGIAIDWSITDWFDAYYRWIPATLRSTQPALFAALSEYPESLNMTTPAWWSAQGLPNITDEVLESVYEVRSSSGVISFVAPTVSGDYAARLIIVLHAHGNVVENWGKLSTLVPSSYTAVAADEDIHAAPFLASPSMSTAIRLTSRLTAKSALLSELVSLPQNSSLNAAGVGLNAPLTAGSTLYFLVIARDEYGNVMEGFTSTDLRTFIASASTQASPPTSVELIAPGRYIISVTPSIAATDYVLTVLVTGSDIYDGPFEPVVVAGATSALYSTAVLVSSGVSLTSGMSIMSTANIGILVTTRDMYSNDRGALGANDTVTLTWAGHNVRLASHGTGTNASRWLFLVDALVSYETSTIHILINGNPIGYDASVSTTDAYADGISVTIGAKVVSPYHSSPAIPIVFGLLASLCIVGTLVLMAYIHKHRVVGMIRASSPIFLQLMLIGALIEYATVIPLTTSTKTQASCAAEALFGHLGFSVIFGTLFVKTSRVKSIFTEKRLMARTLTDGVLMFRLGIIVLMVLVYYTVWMTISPPEPTEVIVNLDSYQVCSSSKSIFPTLIIILECVGVVYGAYLSATIWSLPSLFNESKFLLAAIYNVAVVGGLLTLLVKVVIATPPIQVVFAAVGVIFVTTAVLVAIFLPKVYTVLTNEPLNRVTGTHTFSQLAQQSPPPAQRRVPPVAVLCEGGYLDTDDEGSPRARREDFKAHAGPEASMSNVGIHHPHSILDDAQDETEPARPSRMHHGHGSESDLAFTERDAVITTTSPTNDVIAAKRSHHYKYELNEIRTLDARKSTHVDSLRQTRLAPLPTVEDLHSEPRDNLPLLLNRHASDAPTHLPPLSVTSTSNQSYPRVLTPATSTQVAIDATSSIGSGSGIDAMNSTGSNERSIDNNHALN